MESDRRKIEEAYLKAVDIGYSYHLAKKMEEFKSNPVFGYRTAGSKAEFDTGEFLKEEMERIGLSVKGFLCQRLAEGTVIIRFYPRKFCNFFLCEFANGHTSHVG